MNAEPFIRPLLQLFLHDGAVPQQSGLVQSLHDLLELLQFLHD